MFRGLLQIWWLFSKSVVSPFPSFGEGGVAESRGGRWIHNADNNRLTHSPTTSPYEYSSFPRRRMLNAIDYQIIIFLINFTVKFEEEPNNLYEER